MADHTNFLLNLIDERLKEQTVLLKELIEISKQQLAQLELHSGYLQSIETNTSETSRNTW